MAKKKGGSDNLENIVFLVGLVIGVIGVFTDMALINFAMLIILTAIYKKLPQA